MLNQPVPVDLLKKCAAIARVTHDQMGYRGLPSLVVSRANMIALATIPDALTVMSTASGTWKLRIACWGLVVAIAFLAWRFSWWISLAMLAVVFIDRYLARAERQSWLYLAGTLLGAEILANDFAGWGKAYPEDAARAQSILGGSPSTAWLDFYLPQRHDLTATALAAFGPQS
jgi:hypothetical protein